MHARRVDANHSEVVEQLRQALPAATVHDLSGTGTGIPDLLIGYRGRNYLIELKDGAKAPSRRELTPAQQDFHRKWQGQVGIAVSAAGILAAMLEDGLDPAHRT